jgi:hypothetical protein
MQCDNCSHDKPGNQYPFYYGNTSSYADGNITHEHKQVLGTDYGYICDDCIQNNRTYNIVLDVIYLLLIPVASFLLIAFIAFNGTTSPCQIVTIILLVIFLLRLYFEVTKTEEERGENMAVEKKGKRYTDKDYSVWIVIDWNKMPGKKS